MGFSVCVGAYKANKKVPIWGKWSEMVKIMRDRKNNGNLIKGFCNKCDHRGKWF